MFPQIAFHIGNMILPKYCSNSTYKSILSTGYLSTHYNSVLYFWLNVTIDSFSPWISTRGFVIACAGVGVSEKIFNISSIISSSVHVVSNVMIKFCTTGSDLFINSWRNDLSDCLQIFFILFIQSIHFLYSVPLKVGMAIIAGSSSLLFRAFCDMW